MQTVSIFSNERGQICEDHFQEGTTVQGIIDDLMRCTFQWDYADLDGIIQISRDGSYDYYQK